MIVGIHNFGWRMEINLDYVCRRAGAREKWYDRQMQPHTYIPFTLIHARKIFRLIKTYGEDDVIKKTEQYVTKYAHENYHKSILEQWEKA